MTPEERLKQIEKTMEEPGAWSAQFVENLVALIDDRIKNDERLARIEERIARIEQDQNDFNTRISGRLEALHMLINLRQAVERGDE